MKHYLLAMLCLLLPLAGEAQIKVDSEVSATSHFTWRFYEYGGTFGQTFFDASSEKHNWSFSWWSLFALEFQSTIVEVAPYVTRNFSFGDAHTLGIGATYYWIGREDDSTGIETVLNGVNTGEVYLRYAYDGWLSGSAQFFFDFFNTAYYGRVDLEKSLVPLGKGELGLYLHGGLQYGREDFKPGFSNGTGALQWSWDFPRNLSLSLISGTSYLRENQKWLFQNEVSIAF